MINDVLSGSARWTVVREGLRMLSELPDGSIDALVTDPPYSSGGMFRGDRAKDPVDKYVKTENAGDYVTFDGDNRDQRSFAWWCTLWLGEAHRACKPGAFVAIYTDWRQLPTMTDVVQAAGFVWRGIIPWAKPAGTYRPSPGFPAQCEYVIWGTKGPCVSPVSTIGVLEDAAPRLGRGEDKVHPTQKPVASVRRLVSAVVEGGVLVDPFAGSGTTGVAALSMGRRFIGAEQSDHYRALAVERLAEVTAPGVPPAFGLFGAP